MAGASDESDRRRRGVLHLVVGPSGAGKDTLIDAARLARPDIVYPRRVITRTGGAIGEDHDWVAPPTFDAMEADGAFALSWRAHDLAYGVRFDDLTVLDRPSHALVNVSRRLLDRARAVLAPVRVLSIVAPPETLAARLSARGRETPDDVARRLARAKDVSPTGPDVIEVDNGGALEQSTAAFLSALAPPIDHPSNG